MCVGAQHAAPAELGFAFHTFDHRIEIPHVLTPALVPRPHRTLIHCAPHRVIRPFFFALKLKAPGCCDANCKLALTDKCEAFALRRLYEPSLKVPVKLIFGQNGVTKE